jgi:hypothetical protein
MVRIDICEKCGHRMSEVWKEHDTCEDCGGPVEKVDVDMGFYERAPRILMVGGIGFTVFAILYFLYKIINGDLGQDEGTTSMVMFMVGIAFFAASLIVRTQMSSKAIGSAVPSRVSRRQRRLKGPDLERRANVRSGSVVSPARRTASKLPVDRKR